MIKQGDTIYFYLDTYMSSVFAGTVQSIEKVCYVVKNNETFESAKIPKCMIVTKDGKHRYEIDSLKRKNHTLENRLDELESNVRQLKSYAHKHSLFTVSKVKFN